MRTPHPTQLNAGAGSRAPGAGLRAQALTLPQHLLLVPEPLPSPSTCSVAQDGLEWLILLAFVSQVMKLEA